MQTRTLSRSPSLAARYMFNENEPPDRLRVASELDERNDPLERPVKASMSIPHASHRRRKWRGQCTYLIYVMMTVSREATSPLNAFP